MSRIRGKDTKPEMIVRKLVHAKGFRYRIHDPSIPGKPDLVFKSRKKAIFIHGCYWHRHDCSYGRVVPAANAKFWLEKFEKNVRRDQEVHAQLAAAGWHFLVIWECEIRSGERDRLTERIDSFLKHYNPF
jgi:DNA mismatch endonuclease (patch repair protein)